MTPALWIIFFAGGEGELDGGVAHFAEALLEVTPRADGIAFLRARAGATVELSPRAAEIGVGTLEVVVRIAAAIVVTPRAEATLSIESKRP